MTNLTLATRLNSLEESATLALNARVKQLIASGQTIYNLTAGELDSETPRHIQAAVAATLHLNKYTPVPGLPELRSAIATHASVFYNTAFTPKQVVVTAGAKPALAAAFLALLDPGDEIIVPTPSWVSYRHLIELAGGTQVSVPLTDSWDLNVPAIAAAITPRTKAIIINSPHNPTGAVFSPASLRALAGALAGKSIAVIADDIYNKLTYEPGFKPITAYGFNPDHLVIINGFSKSQGLTGWRIGYTITSPQLAAAITKLLSHVTGNAAVPSQHAALAALAKNDAPAMLPTLTKRRQIVTTALAGIPGIKFVTPGGAFYILLDVRSLTTDSTAWCEQLLAEAHVALVPGDAFDAPGFARLSFAASESTLSAALQSLKTFVTASKTVPKT
ncbi:MAG TPA: aminotransferase class I/II-fold pyridoxal phosphate-dependent enzyme [Candidatus Saccharimonadia bacterium]|jgi:aspartate aminotransferase|nr:aminotransferase class I/II-fold pyridoxal phosphate-dependent enzyme [Candidatus Saccharimonadia bacterium]